MWFDFFSVYLHYPFTTSIILESLLEDLNGTIILTEVGVKGGGGDLGKRKGGNREHKGIGGLIQWWCEKMEVCRGGLGAKVCVRGA